MHTGCHLHRSDFTIGSSEPPCGSAPREDACDGHENFGSLETTPAGRRV